MSESVHPINADATTIQPATIEAVQEAVANAPQIAPHGGGSKSALHTAHTAAARLDLRKLSGILEYEPGEYTFTAFAGTPLATVAAALAEHGQYLPFDPPFVERGATLGGTVAAGLSGSGRYRFGGVRDFLIGVRFVDGQGRLVRGGGKVVKNAAGFDLPKLMVGSLGQFGILTEVSFKVFPRPQAYTTLQVRYANLSAALTGLQRVVGSHFDVHALDLHVEQLAGQAPTYALWLRLGGLSAVLPQRITHLRHLLGSGEAVADREEAALWATVQEATWLPAGRTLVKVALTPGKIAALEALLATTDAQRHYAVGGNLLWIAWAGPLGDLSTALQALGLSGLALIGKGDHPLLGQQSGQHFAKRIKAALDPANRLPTY
jgi:glycolate oxidase FAD binding subunit